MLWCHQLATISNCYVIFVHLSRVLNLLTADHYSDCNGVDELENILSATIIMAKTEAHFARIGVTETILTDNGPYFIASDFKGLCLRYQTNHITSSPYWPKGTGKSEVSVKIFKRIWKNGPHEALLVYRNTPLEGCPGLLPISKELLLPSNNTAKVVQGTIATK